MASVVRAACLLLLVALAGASPTTMDVETTTMDVESTTASVTPDGPLLYELKLNDLIDANLEYFQAMLPPEDSFHGQLQDINSTVGYYSEVILNGMEPLIRIADFTQTVDLTLMTNKITGSIGTEKLSFSVGSITSESFLGPDPLDNIGLEVAKVGFDWEMMIGPNITDNMCQVDFKVKIETDGPVRLVSPYPFYNNTDLTDFFKISFQEFMNEKLSQDLVDDQWGNCDAMVHVMKLMSSILNLS